MKIGILTPHSQLNFGGVLQAWAMLEGAREVCDAETWFLDYWTDARNGALECGVPDWSWRHWVKMILRGLLGGGELSFLLRQWRTKRWMKKCFRKTPFHFTKFLDLQSNDLKTQINQFDLISVGSDQVWVYAPFRLPDPFLLDGAPLVPAIAYAASFGMIEVPLEARQIYTDGFKRFAAIGVREKSAIALVESCGGKATHVADPTLMVGFDFWHRLFKPKEGRRLVYYKLSASVVDDLPRLEEFARKNHCKVDVFVDSAMNQVYYPVSFRRPWKTLNIWWRRLVTPVRLHLGAGPLQFVKAISRAKWVMTDSFHGLMFSTIYGKNVREIKPTLEYRIQMFARIADFAADFIDGDVVSDSISDALASFEKGETIHYRRAEIDAFINRSRVWLADAAKYAAAKSSNLKS